MRFDFGKNWRKFVTKIDKLNIEKAKESLENMFGKNVLVNKSFLDVGAGSGLFSLAACFLGAKVYSFDVDSEAVRCMKYLRYKYGISSATWRVSKGDILDADYISSLGVFDNVYSWGVLHHTGNMWKACEVISNLVKTNGYLYIALYNDQGYKSILWKKIKFFYNWLPSVFRLFVLVPIFCRVWMFRCIKDLLKHGYLSTWKNYKLISRGMNPWRDVVDWVGGYPFEVAKPEDVIEFYGKRGFRIEKLKSVGKGYGCNEFVFRKCK